MLSELAISEYFLSLIGKAAASFKIGLKLSGGGQSATGKDCNPRSRRKEFRPKGVMNPTRTLRSCVTAPVSI
jgi:hypothetical protein